MLKKVRQMSLCDAIKAVEEDRITFATFNKFEIRKDAESKKVRISQTSSNFNSFPANAQFVCFLEVFEKADLKPGYIVETRNKNKLIVLDNCLVSGDISYSLDNFDDKLIYVYNSNEDIVKIYKRKFLVSINELFENNDDCLELIAEINNKSN